MLLYNVLLGILVFLLGTTIGSFLNVVIYRTGSGVGYGGRSKCLSCGKALTARMLVPLFSYLAQRGRCTYCGAKVSMQYPLVEASSGALLVMVWCVTGFDLLASGIRDTVFFSLYAAIWMTLLAITVYDLRHKIIPDHFALCFAILSGILLFLRFQWGMLTPYFIPSLGEYIPLWTDFAAGPLLALPFALLWFFSGGRVMGLGDAKLAWGIGWLLGFVGGVSAIMLSFWAAFFPSLILLFLSQKRFTMKSEIPFAPFLIFGTLIIFAWNIDVLSWIF